MTTTEQILTLAGALGVSGWEDPVRYDILKMIEGHLSLIHNSEPTRPY